MNSLQDRPPCDDKSARVIVVSYYGIYKGKIFNLNMFYSNSKSRSGGQCTVIICWLMRVGWAGEGNGHPLLGLVNVNERRLWLHIPDGVSMFLRLVLKGFLHLFRQFLPFVGHL